MRCLIVALATCTVLSGTLALPRPAEAQTLVRLCASNNAMTVMRTRFIYTDWQGTRHTSQWQTSLAGQRACVTLQDSSDMRIEVEQSQVVQWDHLCTIAAPNGRNTTVFVTTSNFRLRCNAEN